MRVPEYRRALLQLPAATEAWEAYLLAESRLPGPRANLELVAAVTEEGSAGILRALVSRSGVSIAPPEAGTHDASAATSAEPADPRREFLAVCGLAGMGRLLAEGAREDLPTLLRNASNSRWRLREAVAMALQRWGDADPAALLAEMRRWAAGDRYQQRAAAAGLCEPRLLRSPDFVVAVLELLDGMTLSLKEASDRRTDGFRVLRQALGYCWSVAVVAAPSAGMALMERYTCAADPDIRWVMRENLKKNRLLRMDPAWVASWKDAGRQAS
jgi:hypothetical protein